MNNLLCLSIAETLIAVFVVVHVQIYAIKEEKTQRSNDSIVSSSNCHWHILSTRKKKKKREECVIRCCSIDQNQAIECFFHVFKEDSSIFFSFFLFFFYNRLYKRFIHTILFNESIRKRLVIFFSSLL